MLFSPGKHFILRLKTVLRSVEKAAAPRCGGGKTAANERSSSASSAWTFHDCETLLNGSVFQPIFEQMQSASCS